MRRVKCGAALIAVGLSVSACVEVDPPLLGASGALLNNLYLFSDPITITAAPKPYQNITVIQTQPTPNENLSQWGALLLYADQRSHQDTYNADHDTDQMDQSQPIALTINQCYEPVDGGINTLKCDVDDNGKGIDSFIIRQALSDEADVKGYDGSLARDEILITLVSGADTAYLVGKVDNTWTPSTKE